MTDVTRCLLLPDWQRPSDSALKNLCLYWDEIIVPDGTYRGMETPIRADELDATPVRSPDALALEDAGVILRAAQDVPAESFIEHGTIGSDEPDGINLIAIEKDANGRARITGILKRTESALGPPNKESTLSEADVYQAAAILGADSLIARAGLGRELAAGSNLAPVSPSAISHLASLVAPDDDCARAEAALMAAAIESFVVSRDTPIDTLLEFRDKHKSTMQRFRGAMADLAESLRSADVKPEAALEAARDVYKTRVEPSLGALEDRLKEGRVRFAVRSILGAATLTVAPVSPVTAVESGITLGAQTIEYRYSRKRLIDEHPYAYLYRLADSDMVRPRERSATDLLSCHVDPREAVYAFFEVPFRRAFERRDPEKKLESRALKPLGSVRDLPEGRVS